jgi:aminomethyltransferase
MNREALVSPTAPLLQTPLHGWHQSHGARLVEFGGWSMPVQYTSIVEEHQGVRQRVGLFDISHMGRLTFDGADVLDWLERVTTNQVARLADDQIQYSLMANDAGGVIDDILVYRQPFAFLVVCNASNRSSVVAQFERHRGDAAGSMQDRTPDTAMIAIQGPRALETLQPLFGQPLEPVRYYHLTMGRLLGRIETVISRTGYTGEDGFELIVAARAVAELWEALLESGKPYGIQPCGLGARDTLRLEAGMPLYGHELLETINPYSAGLGWAVKLDKRDFVGREALKARKSDPGPTRVGLVLEGRRIARHGAAIFSDDQEIGQVTSGTFSPTLQVSLAMALVNPRAATAGTPLSVDVRGHRVAARVVKLPFYKRSSAAGTPR